MGTSPSLTRDARLKPGEPRGTGGEPLEPQLGSDEDSRGKSIPARSVGGCGCPCPRPVLSPGVRLLPTPQRREVAFSSGVRRSWGGECPPSLSHSHPWPPGGKTASDTQTCLGNLPVRGACCPLGAPCPVICCGGRGAEAPLWADTSLGRGPHFLQHSCRWGAGAGRGPPRAGFCASPCHCVVFSAAGPS